MDISKGLAASAAEPVFLGKQTWQQTYGYIYFVLFPRIPPICQSSPIYRGFLARRLRKYNYIVLNSFLEQFE